MFCSKPFSEEEMLCENLEFIQLYEENKSWSNIWSSIFEGKTKTSMIFTESFAKKDDSSNIVSRSDGGVGDPQLLR